MMTKKTKAQRIAEGLALIAAYPSAACDAQHDVLYAGADELTDADATSLKALGWHYDDEVESWAIFT
jgi:hypothetical protein